MSTQHSVQFAVGDARVSGLFDRPPAPRALVVLAHGAGAGMRHPFLNAIAARLVEREFATFRYQFPYMDARRRRPDPPGTLVAGVRAAVEEVALLAPELPLFAGGKSLGGRMTSTAQAERPLPGVRGLVFLGFPLHPPGRLGTHRADHLDAVTLPMLFLQGTRDDFAGLDLLRPVIERLGRRATLHLIETADHSFHVLKRSGLTDAKVLHELADAVVQWAGPLC
jgi:hypothetical protein